MSYPSPPSLLNTPAEVKKMSITKTSQTHASAADACKRHRHVLPAVLMRAGTSKGLFIQRRHLPVSETEWAPAILAAMGSADADPRQVDGLGGATSTTSKVAVVGPSLVPGADVDYTFVQVGVGSSSVDLSGSCGNMASGVGPFAVEEGMVHVDAPVSPGGIRSVDIRVFNTNTQRLYIETVNIDAEGHVVEDGDYTIPGVFTPGSEIKIGFVEPAGSMTGRLFPSGSRVDVLRVALPTTSQVRGPWPIRTTLIDAANPFVVVDAASLPPELRIGLSFTSPVPGITNPILNDMELAPHLAAIEAIRRAGAVRMGLAASVEKAALTRGTPKIVVVWPPAPLPAVNVATKDSMHADIQVLAFSMGKPHPTLQLTGAVCLGAAVCVPGTVAWDVSHSSVGFGAIRNRLPPSPERTPSPVFENEEKRENRMQLPPLSPEVINTAAGVKRVRIAHRKGTIDVDCVASLSTDDSGNESGGMLVEKCTVSRTARRLFEGKAYYYS